MVGDRRDYILERLAARVTQATIWRLLVHEHGLQTSVASFRRWVAANLPAEVRREQVRI